LKLTGIICEYNPFHAGHQKQIDIIRGRFGGDCGIVCLMSGNFVQRGAPAILEKSLRAKAAVLCGADVVLELPAQYALSSAEGFAAGGVKILSGFCDTLCFGSESGNAKSLMAVAEKLLSPDFPEALHRELSKGLSFAAARQAALGDDGKLLQNPNDILAAEYCKAILSQNSALQPMPIVREGAYHAETADPENPSATSIRKLLLSGQDWKSCIPPAAQEVFDGAPLHTIAAGERAILARLRTMTDAEFQSLPYGSEGLWRKFMHACRSQATLEDIIAATKSKRYARTRIDRMVMCAFLGISVETLTTPPPYVRVLALGEKGSAVLRQMRLTGDFPHVGEAREHPQWLLEQRWEDLYGLFQIDHPASAGAAAKQRIFVKKP